MNLLPILSKRSLINLALMRPWKNIRRSNRMPRPIYISMKKNLMYRAIGWWAKGIAIQNYEKSLELNPDNENGKTMLKKLKKIPDSKWQNPNKFQLPKNKMCRKAHPPLAWFQIFLKYYTINGHNLNFLK